MYVANSTALLVSVQRQTKLLSFEAPNVRAATNIAGSSENANDILNPDKFGGKGSGGNAASFHNRIHVELSPQDDALPAMNRSVVENIAKSLAKANQHRPYDTGLFKWTKHQEAIITTDAVHGPSNPFWKKETEDSFGGAF
jgi:hypothetical protein